VCDATKDDRDGVPEAPDDDAGDAVDDLLPSRPLLRGRRQPGREGDDFVVQPTGMSEQDSKKTRGLLTAVPCSRTRQPRARSPRAASRSPRDAAHSGPSASWVHPRPLVRHACASARRVRRRRRLRRSRQPHRRVQKAARARGSRIRRRRAKVEEREASAWEPLELALSRWTSGRRAGRRTPACSCDLHARASLPRYA
jgi:hypothetical protein